MSPLAEEITGATPTPQRATLFLMARIAILTASDKASSGQRDDLSGETIARYCSGAGHEVVLQEIVADERDLISEHLRVWCRAEVADVILTTGGTGLTARDVTPEATRDVAERDVPGIPIALALAGLQQTPYAALTRGVAVTRGNTLIVNLPGSPRAVEQGMDVLLPLLSHIADLLSGPVEHESPPPA